MQLLQMGTEVPWSGPAARYEERRKGEGEGEEEAKGADWGEKRRKEEEKERMPYRRSRVGIMSDGFHYIFLMLLDDCIAVSEVGEQPECASHMCSDMRSIYCMHIVVTDSLIHSFNQ
jgi:hypothetical protein